MNYRAGFLKILWMMIMLHFVEANLSCKPRQLASLTKHEMEICLTKFDEANGKPFGTWVPGFPELTVEHNSSVVGAKVQCSLLFLAQSLERILDDQKNDLNPEDVSLHKVLRESISRVGLLGACLQGVLGGKCSSPPSPPEMPTKTFERKQWSHTLLTAGAHYLHWLQHKLPTPKSKKSRRVALKQRATELQTYREGSGHLF
ncbi:uncharacterized protein LOC129456531 [Periophthalmus magnuspinnatus]|uniref:uncharacterized protein LOC129456531 n=1 Tax=Periophthalmus magnuspinnatus TaxID=409849 RepID=UPI002436C4A8|nr:uncharacterized protein LOC129456531 [Periophthalmus magnuspinnatus]